MAGRRFVEQLTKLLKVRAALEQLHNPGLFCLFSYSRATLPEPGI